MKKLVSVENIGGRIQKTWLHHDSDGKLVTSVETIQDVEPVFDYVKSVSEVKRTNPDLRYAGSIPANVIEDVCKEKALEWGEKKHHVFRELMSGKTDRAKKVWRELLYGRDYRRFQAQ